MFTIDYCGYHVHNRDYDMIFRPAGTDSHLFLLILSPMIFYLPEQPPEKVQPGACILYASRTCHHYQAEKEFFNSYIHFWCDESLFEEYDIKTNTIFYPTNPEEINQLIQKLYLESINRLHYATDMADLLLRQLLISLHRIQQSAFMSKTNRYNYYPELLALRENVLNQCEYPWTIDEMCRKICIEKSQFYHYYKNYFHLSPKEELQRARLMKARYYLTNDAMSIKQAAFASGFDNICYFNRYFKKQYGMTPGEFKKHSGSINRAT